MNAFVGRMSYRNARGVSVLEVGKQPENWTYNDELAAEAPCKLRCERIRAGE